MTSSSGLSRRVPPGAGPVPPDSRRVPPDSGRVPPDSGRVPPAPSGELGPLARLLAWGAGRVTGAGGSRIFATLGRHRRLFRAWLPFAGTMLFRTRLPRRDVELVVLRTACNCSSPYEWAQHAWLARKSGLSAAAAGAVPDWRARRNDFSDRQLALLAATDELHDRRIVSEATWGRLTGLLDERQLIELCMLVGHYEMVAMTLNSLGVEPEPEALAALDSLDGGARETAERLSSGLRPSSP